jgi:hypothetical protein
MRSREQKKHIKGQEREHAHTGENTNPAKKMNAYESALDGDKDGAEREKDHSDRLTKFPHAVDMNRHQPHRIAGRFKGRYCDHLVWHFQWWAGVPKVITSGTDGRTLLIFVQPSWEQPG